MPSLLVSLLSVAVATEPSPVELDPPSPARRCADAAAGTEIETCLRLAAEHPDAVEPIAAAVLAHVDRTQGPDRALLRALRLALNPAFAAQGVAALGELDDERAVGPLAWIGAHAHTPVAVAAAAALGPHPTGRAVLARWIVDPSLPLEVRTAATRALGDAGTADADAALADIARQPALPTEVRAALSRALADVPGAPPVELQTSTRGAAWLAGGAALGLGTAMGAAGQLGRSELQPVGAVAGGLAGTTMGWLYGRAWPMEAGPASLITTSLAAGGAAGALVFADSGGDALALGALGGEVLGASAAWAARGRYVGRPADALEGVGLGLGAGLASAAAWRAAGGARGSEVRVAGIGLAAGTLLGQAVAPAVSLDGADRVWVGVSTALGASAGALLSADRGVPDPAPVLAGSGVGLAAGYALGALVSTGPDVAIGAAAGAALGGLAVGGVVSSVAPDDPGALRVGALSGAAAGSLIGAGTAWIDPAPLDDRDVVLAASLAGVAEWHALVLAPRSGALGPAIAAPALGAVAAAAASRNLDVPVPSTLAASSLGLWGAYAGGVSALLAAPDGRASFESVGPASLVGTDAGLLVGAVLLSRPLAVPPLVLGVADASGAIGASGAVLLVALATEDRDVLLGSSLVGAAAGFVIGGLVGTRWERQENRVLAASPRFVLPGHASISPLAGGAPGATVSLVGW